MFMKKTGCVYFMFIQHQFITKNKTIKFICIIDCRFDSSVIKYSMRYNDTSDVMYTTSLIPLCTIVLYDFLKQQRSNQSPIKNSFKDKKYIHCLELKYLKSVLYLL